MSFLKYIVITAVTITAMSLLIHGGAFGIYEDQLKVCNFKDVCQIVNTDDYMTKKSSAKLWDNFNKDLDTFTELQALDEECRDNYHSFCFGEAWSSLKEFLN